jgi:hypothetical protein
VDYRAQNVVSKFPRHSKTKGFCTVGYCTELLFTVQNPTEFLHKLAASLEGAISIKSDEAE